MRGSILIMVGALALTPLVVTPALASDKADVMATVKQYDDAFNKNDMKAWDALCSDQPVIIDDFAPHVWQGANTCSDWWNALDAANRKSGMSDGKVALGDPWHVAITGDHAYAVYPTRYSYMMDGKAVSERGVWTLVLQKKPAGWRITGWAWAQR
ncbi:MAG: YybH family protein [Rhizomicrobium sp.]